MKKKINTKKISKQLLKKSIDKIIKKSYKKTHRKRGRPKGSKGKKLLKHNSKIRLSMKEFAVDQKILRHLLPEEHEETKESYKESRMAKLIGETKIGKVLGLCPKCNACVSTLDLIKKLIFVCSSCGVRVRTKSLKKYVPKVEPINITKKEYLESHINKEHLEKIEEKNEESED